MRPGGPDKVWRPASELASAVSSATRAATDDVAAAEDAAAAAPPSTARPSSSSECAENRRARRRSSRCIGQISNPRANSALPGASCRTDSAVTGRSPTILATSKGADRGTEPASDGKDRMDFKGLRARAQGAKGTGGEELDGLCMSPTGGASQVEARTPPAMERNLFLSALANGKLEHHRNDVMITLKRVVAGGLAGMLAKSVVAPVDRVKILFQVTNEKFSFKKAEKLFQDILALEGPAGLWKGNSATMIRVFPYAGTQFMMFDSLKRWALQRKTRRDPNAEQRLSNMESLMSGSFAGATSALVTYPLDLARARLAVGHVRKLGGRRRTMGVPELLKVVVRQDGFKALYRGVTPSLLGIIPYAGIAFSINEQAKHKVIVLTGKEPGTFHKLGIGALAGLIAQSCTYPLEVTRRRMQTHGLIDTQSGVNKVFEVPKAGVVNEPKPVHRLNILQTFMGVFKEQGAGGLFKGLSMNWVKGPVGISISFTTFDFLKRQFGIS